MDQIRVLCNYLFYKDYSSLKLSNQNDRFENFHSTGTYTRGRPFVFPSLSPYRWKFLVGERQRYLNCPVTKGWPIFHEPRGLKHVFSLWYCWVLKGLWTHWKLVLKLQLRIGECMFNYVWNFVLYEVKLFKNFSCSGKWNGKLAYWITSFIFNSFYWNSIQKWCWESYFSYSS